VSIVNYGIYTIQCLLASPTPVDSGYFHVPNASRAPRAPITQYSWSQRKVTFTDHFEFVLIRIQGRLLGRLTTSSTGAVGSVCAYPRPMRAHD
jgi:hypothetical protein